MDEDFDRLLTVTEVQEYLGLGRSKVYDLMVAGELRSLRIGTSRRVPVSVLREFVARAMEDGS